MRTPAVLVGKAVGDSLGMPFEQPRDKVHPGLKGWSFEMLPGIHHQLPAGHWTDDTEMAVALAEVLIDNGDGSLQPDKIARAYYDWSQGTPHGMGGTTRRAMENLAAGKPYHESGVRVSYPYEVGSGTAMRCAPLGVVFGGQHSLDHAAATDAAITHDNKEARAASVVVASCVDAAIRIPRISGARLLEAALMSLVPNYGDTVLYSHIQRVLEMYELQARLTDVYSSLWNTGQVIFLVPTALFCAARYTGDYQGGVIAAVQGGGDTDTRAAVTGAILGARNGIEGIPASYLGVLYKRDYLMELDRKLMELRLGRR